MVAYLHLAPSHEVQYDALQGFSLWNQLLKRRRKRRYKRVVDTKSLRFVASNVSQVANELMLAVIDNVKCRRCHCELDSMYQHDYSVLFMHLQYQSTSGSWTDESILFQCLSSIGETYGDSETGRVSYLTTYQIKLEFLHINSLPALYLSTPT